MAKKHKMACKAKSYWQDLFSSTKKVKMSKGASKINKIISWARGDNWRRNSKKSKNKSNK